MRRNGAVTSDRNAATQSTIRMSSGSQTLLPRHEVWRMQYRSRPYLSDTSDDALEQRLKDVLNNLTTLSTEGKIGMLPIGPDGVHWMVVFTHILEEYRSRRKDLPILSDVPFPKPTAPDRPKSVSALESMRIPRPGEALIKLGRRAHMRDLYERGRIRISPASSYSDPSLNHAIRDDEMELAQVMPASEVTITFLDEETGEAKTTKPISNVTTTTSVTTNYYVYCMSQKLSYRLFDDFEADSCVIIREPEKFASRLLRAMSKNLPSWVYWSGPVEYIDPYLRPTKEINLFVSKHFRYWYQREHRFSWVPQMDARAHLQPIFVELGSLKRISDIVFL